MRLSSPAAAEISLMKVCYALSNCQSKLVIWVQGNSTQDDCRDIIFEENHCEKPTDLLWFLSS